MINIIIITNIIEVMTIKMMLLTIITLPCDYIVTNTKYFSLSASTLWICNRPNTDKQGSISIDNIWNGASIQKIAA